MSNTPMTNEQKAVKIATWNGATKYIDDENKVYYWLNNHEQKYYIPLLTKSYLTDLNYLVPVAVKVRSAINNYDASKQLGDIFMRLCYQMATYDKTPENTYQPLFDAVYEAIIYLENQNA